MASMNRRNDYVKKKLCQCLFEQLAFVLRQTSEIMSPTFSDKEVFQNKLSKDFKFTTYDQCIVCNAIHCYIVELFKLVKIKQPNNI